MPDLPTFDSMFRTARDEVLTRNGRISREAVEREGMDANVLVASAVAAADEVIGQVARLLAGLFLDSAQQEDLDRLVFDRYGLVRKPAAASQGTVQFSTTVPTGTAFTIPVGVKVQTADGIQFVTTESIIFPNASTGPIACMVSSVLAGGDQNVKAVTINSIISQITSQPTDLVVNNPYATAGGDDAETDESLRDRARRFFTTARRGTLAALEEAALGVGGVRQAKAIEVIDSLGRPTRFVQLVVSDAFTEQFVTFDVVPPRYQTLSQALTVQVFNALADVRPAGTFVQVVVANVVLQAFQLSLTFNAGADVNTAALSARAAVVNYVNSLKPGDDIVIADILTALSTVTGLAQSGAAVVSPPGDVVSSATQIFKTSLGLVTAVSAQTDQPITTGVNPDSFSLATS